jgi:hypothetical protein
MRRYLIFSGIALFIIILLWWSVNMYRTKHTKSFSPEEYVSYEQGDLTVKVFYNRPWKKGREIFGGLVPYDKVWRTGANEATTFEINRDIVIEGKTLRRGKYSLWTIPRPEMWTIIFNAETGQWGINADGEANRSEDLDVLTVEVPAVRQEKVFEQFEISFNKLGEEAEMVLLWDRTLVSIPFSF